MAATLKVGDLVIPSKVAFDNKPDRPLEIFNWLIPIVGIIKVVSPTTYVVDWYMQATLEVWYTNTRRDHDEIAPYRESHDGR